MSHLNESIQFCSHVGYLIVAKSIFIEAFFNIIIQIFYTKNVLKLVLKRFVWCGLNKGLLGT